MSSLLTWLLWGVAADPWSVALTVHGDRAAPGTRTHYGRCDFACPANLPRAVTLPALSRALFHTDEQAAEARFLLEQVRAALVPEPVTIEAPARARQ